MIFIGKNLGVFFCFTYMKQSETNFTPENSEKYVCNTCNFICSKKSDYMRHSMTRKHKNSEKCNKNETNLAPFLSDLILTENVQYGCKCGKLFNNRTTCWRHKKKCQDNNVIENKNVVEVKKPPSMDVETLTLLLIDTVKQNQEFQSKLMDMIKDGSVGCNNTVNSNNVNTNSNNSFNLNFFLNETCKDAMNIKDFIDSLQVHFQDLEYNGENGYADGISKIFLRELNQLDICKRPIHCSDVKREVFHIKNENSWEKERELIIRCIKQITKKNVILLADWRNAHPGCMDLHNKINDKYNKINCETMGPYLDDEELKCFNKIISNVAKATIIDKKGISSR